MINRPSINILVFDVDDPTDLIGVTKTGELADDLEEADQYIPFIQLIPESKILLLKKRCQEIGDQLKIKSPESKTVVVCRENVICEGKIAHDLTLNHKHLKFLKSTMLELSRQYPTILFVPGTIATQREPSPEELKAVLKRYEEPVYQWLGKKEVEHFEEVDQLFRLNKNNILNALKSNKKMLLISNDLYAYYDGNVFQHGKLINGPNDYITGDYDTRPDVIHELPSVEQSSPLLRWENTLIGFDICKLSDEAFRYMAYAVSQSKEQEKPLLQLVIANNLSHFSLMPESIHSKYGAIHIDRHQPVVVLARDNPHPEQNIQVYFSPIGQTVNLKALTPLPAIYPLRFRLLNEIDEVKNQLTKSKETKVVSSIQTYTRCVYQHPIHKKKLIDAFKKKLPEPLSGRLIKIIKEYKRQAAIRGKKSLTAHIAAQVDVKKKKNSELKPCESRLVFFPKEKDEVLIKEPTEKKLKIAVILPESKLQTQNVPAGPVFKDLIPLIMKLKLPKLDIFLWLGDYFGVYIKSIYKESNTVTYTAMREKMKTMAVLFYSLAARFDNHGERSSKMLRRIKAQNPNRDFSFVLSQLQSDIPERLDFETQFKQSIIQAEILIRDIGNLKLCVNIMPHLVFLFNRLNKARLSDQSHHPFFRSPGPSDAAASSDLGETSTLSRASLA